MSAGVAGRNRAKYFLPTLNVISFAISVQRERRSSSPDYISPSSSTFFSCLLSSSLSIALLNTQSHIHIGCLRNSLSYQQAQQVRFLSAILACVLCREAGPWGDQVVVLILLILLLIQFIVPLILLLPPHLKSYLHIGFPLTPLNP